LALGAEEEEIRRACGAVGEGGRLALVVEDGEGHASGVKGSGGWLGGILGILRDVIGGDADEGDPLPGVVLGEAFEFR
jgi:hypothetical protein